MNLPPTYALDAKVVHLSIKSPPQAFEFGARWVHKTMTCVCLSKLVNCVCSPQDPVLATVYIALTETCGGGLVFPNAKKIPNSPNLLDHDLARVTAYINGSLAAVRHTKQSIEAVAALPGSIDGSIPPLEPFCKLKNRFRLALQAGDAVAIYNLDPQLVSASCCLPTERELTHLQA